MNQSIALPADSVIAVTGASGFVGGHILTQLQNAGLQSRLLVRNPDKLKSSGEFALIRGSLTNQAALDRLMDGVTAVIHCAGSVRGVTREQFDRANVDGTGACARAASEAGVSRFLLISSLAAREPGISPYAASKKQGEEVVARQAGKMGVTIFRPPAVYGPGDKELLPLLRIMAKGYVPIVGSRDARFSFIYVADLAEAVLAWLGTAEPPKRVFEIDDGKEGGYGWLDFAETVAGITGKPVKPLRIPSAVLGLPAAVNYLMGRLSLYSPMLTPGKVRELSHPDWVCRMAPDRGLPGWQPRHTLREGLLKTPGWRG